MPYLGSFPDSNPPHRDFAPRVTKFDRPPSRPTRTESFWYRWQEFVLFTLPLYVGCVIFKRRLLVGSAEEGRILARNGLRQTGSWWHSEYFALDSILVLVLVPALLALVTARASARMRRLIAFVVLGVMLLGVTVAWTTWEVVGRLPTAALARDFLDAYRNDANLVAPASFLPAAILRGALLLLAAGAAPLLLMSIASVRGAWSRWLRVPLVVAVVALVAMQSFSVARSRRHTTLHRPVAVGVASALLARGMPAHNGAPALAREEILRRHRAITWPSAPVPPAARLASATTTTPRNLVLIILETHAAADYDFADSTHWPAVARLLPHALLARRHYTTYPTSARSDFSVFTSLYDLPGPRSIAQEIDGKTVPALVGVPRVLRDAGYDTRYFYGAERETLSEERWLLPVLGFEHVVLGNEMGKNFSSGERLRADLFAFDAASRRIRARPPGAPPFFYVVRTTLGHDPLYDPAARDSVARTPTEKRAARGAIARAEDAMIGTLVASLTETHQLEHTTLIILGDHGSRLREERLVPGVLSDLSFRVPMLVYDAGRFASPVVLSSPTSHIDVAPTAFALLHVPDRTLHMGTSMVDSLPAGRTLFLFGEGFFGADGAVRDDAAYMRNYITGQELESRGGLDFSAAQEGAPLSAEGLTLRQSLEAERDLLMSVLRTIVSSAHEAGK